MEVTEPN